MDITKKSEVTCVEAFHRSHTEGGKCSYCGAELVKFGTCTCPQYLKGWEEVEKGRK